MAKKKIILGIVAGVAILSVAALFLSNKFNADLAENSEDDADEDQHPSMDHHGIAIANKARHRAQHLVSSIRKQS